MLALPPVLADRREPPHGAVPSSTSMALAMPTVGIPCASEPVAGRDLVFRQGDRGGSGHGDRRADLRELVPVGSQDRQLGVDRGDDQAHAVRRADLEHRRDEAGIEATGDDHAEVGIVERRGEPRPVRGQELPVDVETGEGTAERTEQLDPPSR